jgi:hypothetical protein
MQGGVGRAALTIRNLIVGASVELAHDGRGEGLLNAVASGVILEHWDSDGVKIRRQLNGLSGGVISATR